MVTAHPHAWQAGCEKLQLRAEAVISNADGDYYTISERGGSWYTANQRLGPPDPLAEPSDRSIYSDKRLRTSARACAVGCREAYAGGVVSVLRPEDRPGATVGDVVGYTITRVRSPAS